MSDTITFKVEGLSELGKQLQSLSSDMQHKICRAMTNAAAQVVKRQAIENAPESEEPHKVDDVVVDPGNLKRNIVVKRVSKTNLTSEHIVTVRGKRKDGYAARYGRLQEHGTVKMSPRPFLKPALESNLTKLPQVMADKGREGIAKAVKPPLKGRGS